ncbi:sensor histidine kinase, partial [Devosia chinhatensis]|uniref:sensor histidine kinase n=1 Tax=Devosia chinhatensis TaxID=429727 RepID=UPI003CC7AF5B
MDAGKFESSSQPFNFHRAINALVASLKVAATAKRLQLDVQLDEAIDNLPQSMEVNGQKASYVVGDEIRLRQVLTNIASNAVKFSREGKGGIKVR